MNFETPAITAVAGVLAGWLTGFVMKSGGYGAVGDVGLGVLGGVVGGFVQRKFWNLETAATR
jgi:uncharacterized membrane protein YeaQ/YmgE (transglycosylase-associated protein family)